MRYDVGIIGGGVIGLACAWRLAQAGAQVAVFERGQVGHEASWAAAGMLAPQCEMMHYPPQRVAQAKRKAMFGLCHQSREMYRAFADELLAATGIDIELSLQGHSQSDWRIPGILYVLEAGDKAAIAAIREKFPASQFIASGSPEAPDFGSLLSSRPFVKQDDALWLPDEGQVENRRLVRALHMAITKVGVQIHQQESIERVRVEGSRITSLINSEREVQCAHVLLCAGAWSGQIQGLPRECLPPIKPIAGQIIALHEKINAIRSIVYSRHCYVVPRRDGHLLIGATMEDTGFEKSVTVGGVTQLLGAATALIPALSHSSITDQWAGLRPGTPDGLPVLGRTAMENLYVATGHFRNGILLTPVTAKLMADCLLKDVEPPAEFSLQRFQENQAEVEAGRE
ncbi:MAG: glycine oxidase ThiO [Abitibacteriaceae bacterium]|nr:glycine oxidase ThiO [Abditibacteriaceae bacterium]